jgi:hypothetical protein
MSGRSRKMTLGAAGAVLLAVAAWTAWRCLTACDLPSECASAGRLPHIRPDYADIVIPPNVAPMNFLVEEPGVECRVRIHADQGEDILVAARDASVVIPPRPWRELLAQNRGGRILLDVYVKNESGRWSLFDSIKNDVAREEIDSHLAYRLLGPLCNAYRNMGIYQRNLETFDESPILTNETFGGCVNCHCFPNRRADTFCFHVRPGQGKEKIASGMVLVRDGHAARQKTRTKTMPMPPSYTSWHPTGPVAAFSMNKPQQCFRGSGNEIREVFDLHSDLAAVNVETGAVSTSPGIADPNRMETFPGWSADGKTLYFCSAKPLLIPGKPPAVEQIDHIMYDLMRVRYDLEKNEWGQPETILSAAETGMSITEPRASPDGRYLLFCMSSRGGFPIYQASTDLYLMDLKSGKHRRLACNSEQADSWHCWSSNSRWIVFSSKRDNGLLARPYFCYIDSDGREHKPFILPQKDPAFYDAWLRTYNVPELIAGPVAVSQDELLRAVRAEDLAIDGPVKADAPAKAGDSPYQNN